MKPRHRPETRKPYLRLPFQCTKSVVARQEEEWEEDVEWAAEAEEEWEAALG